MKNVETTIGICEMNYGMSQLLKSSVLPTLVPNKQIIATSTSNHIYKLVKRHSALPSKYNNLSMKMQQTIY